MKKYVQVGCGYRGIIAYSGPLVKNYGDCAELCGVYDTNPKICVSILFINALRKLFLPA